MRRLKALRSGIYYDGRTLGPGDEFEAENAHAVVLTASGAAAEVKRDEQTEPAPYATADMQANGKRPYRRKDLAAG